MKWADEQFAARWKGVGLYHTICCMEPACVHALTPCYLRVICSNIHFVKLPLVNLHIKMRVCAQADTEKKLMYDKNLPLLPIANCSCIHTVSFYFILKSKTLAMSAKKEGYQLNAKAQKWKADQKKCKYTIHFNIALFQANVFNGTWGC